jgi:hypothetical protein
MAGMAGAGPASPFSISSALMIAMMIGMMLPNALPRIARHGLRFGTGYIVVWTAFGALAALVQFELDRAGLLSQAMALRSIPLAAPVVVGAGLYQFTPLKRACLARDHRVRYGGASASSRGERSVRAARRCDDSCEEFGALVRPGFAQDIFRVIASRRTSDREALRNLAIGRAGQQHAKHLAFAAGQLMLRGNVFDRITFTHETFERYRKVSVVFAGEIDDAQCGSGINEFDRRSRGTSRFRDVAFDERSDAIGNIGEVQLQ